MTVLDPPGLRQLFRGHLRGHLRGVASHRVANHGLQRLLDHAPEDVVEEVLSELGPALQEPLARGHPGVVVALLGAAQRHPRLQGAALRWLFQVGHAPFARPRPLPADKPRLLRVKPRPLLL
ncbi:nucleolar protein 9 [Parus major]|uniref:nucleolar protein 9 n=1 Tax=Parus major TaxID=9157 RepID=UPI0007716416|nr:nucleolar protein 9 [Parus major]